MKIEKMIEELKRIAEIAPGTDVKLHHPDGNVALFCLCTVRNGSDNNSVFIEDESDINIEEELYSQIVHADNINMSKKDLIEKLLEIGFTWNHFKKYLMDDEYERFLEAYRRNDNE